MHLLEVFSVLKITLIVFARDIMIVIDLIVCGESIVWMTIAFPEKKKINLNPYKVS